MKKMIRNSLVRFAYLPAMLALLAVPSPLLAKQGVHIVGDEILVEEETDDSGVPDDIDGPLNDMMSDSGVLFGDLYRLARYQGFVIEDGVKKTQTKRVPRVDQSGVPDLVPGDWIDEDGNPVLIDPDQPELGAYQVEQQAWDVVDAVGGEPILTEGFAKYTILDEYGNYEINQLTNDIYFPAPYPSQCVQPVADYERWGDISSKSGLPDNRIPLVMTYDPTWKRTECEVDPGLYIDVPEDDEGKPIPQYVVTGADGTVYYTVNDILWADLVQEVEFGRLNLARAPQAVLDASFDEAISSLNAATDIKIDASGRLMVTTEIYDEFLTDENGDPLWVATEVKAIDSPKENLALYLKLMKDGHLITPADERVPIDYSVYGGMPINQLLELEDGPSDAPRPTIDIVKMQSFGLGHLVDAGTIETYYIRMEEDGSLYLDENGVMDIDCSEPDDDEETTDSPNWSKGQYCVEYEGVVTPSDIDKCAGDDFPLAASFFAAAADKKGNITVDKIVYINSILGINKVVGYSEDGTINYAKNPVYFNYGAIPVYDRLDTYGNKELGYCNANRGQAQDTNGDGIVDLDDRNGDGSYSYDGMVELLEEIDDDSRIVWEQKYRYISERVFGDVNVDSSMTDNIAGFNSMADDDLQVIITTHTYQIPGLR